MEKGRPKEVRPMNAIPKPDAVKAFLATLGKRSAQLCQPLCVAVAANTDLVDTTFGGNML